MIDNINSNLSFTGRPNVKKILPKAQKKFKNFCAGVESPSHMCYFTPADDLSPSIIRDLNHRLGFTREYRKSLIADGGLPEYFRGLIGIVKAFKVANCDEFAEIMKIILRLNRVKRCDMFALYSQKGNEAPKALDHCVVALNIPKSKNNKKSRIPFAPKDNVKIVDMWWHNGFVGNIKKAKKMYRIFGLQKDEKLMLRPLNTLEPDKKCFDKILTDFPMLKIK